MAKKAKKQRAFTLNAPKGGDILIFRSAEGYSEEQMQAVDRAVRQKNPNWDGVLLVLKPGQTFEKLGEPMARALYAALKNVFEAPPPVPEAASNGHDVQAAATPAAVAVQV